MDSFDTNHRDKEYRRITRKRIILISVSTTLLLVVIIGAVLGTRNNKSGYSPHTSTSTSTTIKAACDATRYPDTCFSSLSAAEGPNSTSDPTDILKLSLSVAISALQNISSLPDSLAAQTTDATVQAGLADCKELITTAADRITEILNSIPDKPSATAMTDLRTWLSAAVTDQVTCLDGVNGTIGDKLSSAMLNATRLTSNSLAFATGIQQTLDQYKHLLNRRLLADVPQRALVQILSQPKANVTVAKDGSGHFRTINGALSQIKKKSDQVFVIYIKSGVYEENVVIDKNMWNVMMIGDGMYKTIVTGRLNVVDGSTTFRSATVAVVGRGFVAKDMGFRNTAGPQKEQAVAFRSASDLSVYYRCSFDAFQDTLYVYALRQFYSECHIIGSVDFIFGDAAAFFEDCQIFPRQPLPGQKNAVTAQGRSDPNENTGISIHNCAIEPFDNVTVPTYLGRPWKSYSTTVVMQTKISKLVVPEGWLAWTSGVVPPPTIFYAEYQNSGPGASLDQRVKWPGYKGMLTPSQAQKFAVENFIGGEIWIPKTGVQVSTNL